MIVVAPSIPSSYFGDFFFSYSSFLGSLDPSLGGSSSKSFSSSELSGSKESLSSSSSSVDFFSSWFHLLGYFYAPQFSLVGLVGPHKLFSFENFLGVMGARCFCNCCLVLFHSLLQQMGRSVPEFQSFRYARGTGLALLLQQGLPDGASGFLVSYGIFLGPIFSKAHSCPRHRTP